MKISINEIRFINLHNGSAGDPAPDGVDALVEKIGAQLGAVEEIIPFGDRFRDVLIVKVVSCDDHPKADRLHVCKIDDGGKAQGVERDENGLVQVVCGAPNVRAGMFAAWLPPGTTVPSTMYDPDPFVLDVRPLRGVPSNGMMASPRELTIGDNHEGILEITKDNDEQELAPGMRFAEVWHLDDDAVIDIENKMFTHRPDCFGLLGIAREIEGISQRPYKSPAWYTMRPAIPDVETEELPLEVRNEIPELVPRFTAIAMRNIEIKPSPLWLQLDMVRAGLRPINNIVDYTNFFMLETGQPLHAYDYDKVKALSAGDHPTIVVRQPHEGEKITLLNGKEIEPRREAIMIATDKQLIGVGGVMGGADTEVDEHTKNIIIEAASFDMYSIRRTSMAHGLFTDAVTRFTKGQSPLQNAAVSAKIVDEIRTFAAGKVASPFIDVNHLPAEVMERGSLHPPVTITTQFINERLGLELTAPQMATLLTNVEFEVGVEGDELTVKAPFWRTDIEIREDVVEEIGRLYGYDHLPLNLPQRDLTPAARNAQLELKREIRDHLSRSGANEVLTYTFAHGNLLKKVGQDPARAFQLSNALSPDLQYFRLSLIPSLLDKVHSNIKAGNDTFALFEINKVHGVDMLDEEGLPAEFMRLALVFASDDKTAAQNRAGAPYYEARQYFASLAAAKGLQYDLRPLNLQDLQDHPLLEQMAMPFETGRSAAIHADGRIVGIVGEYRAAVRKALKLPAYCAGFEVFTSAFANGQNTEYRPLSRFPKVEQDICFRLPAATPFQQIFDLVENQVGKLRPEQTHVSIAPVDIYQRKDDHDHKQITLRISLVSYERTLTDQEVSRLLDTVAQAAAKDLSAERI